VARGKNKGDSAVLDLTNDEAPPEPVLEVVEEDENPVHRWRNRIVGYGEEAPEQLLANSRNYRIHPQRQQDALSAVLDEVGFVQDVIVNKTTNTVVDGHLRVALAISRGEPSIPVKYVDLTEDEEILVLATLDPLSSWASYDRMLLSQTAPEAMARTLSDVTKAFLAELVAKNPPPVASLGFAADAEEEGDAGEAPGSEDAAFEDSGAAVPVSHVKMVQLFLTQESYPGFAAQVNTLQEAWGLLNVTDAVVRAVANCYEAIFLAQEAKPDPEREPVDGAAEVYEGPIPEDQE
jgi:hypothetical protein